MVIFEVSMFVDFKTRLCISNQKDSPILQQSAPPHLMQQTTIDDV
jgi:hypothetical protein